MTNKMITGKIRIQKNQNGAIQKIVTIPKQEETRDWDSGDLVLIDRLELKQDSDIVKTEANNL